MEPENPEPPRDYAARFTFGESSAPQAPSQPGPNPSRAPVTGAQAPWGLASLFEATLTAPFNPWAAFGAAAGRPAPGFGLLATNVAIFAAAFLVLNIVHAAALYPSAITSQPPERFLIVGAAALALALAASLAAAGIVQAAAAAAGGEADFLRSYQAVSMLSLALPLQAAAFWVPDVAFAPALLAALGATAALERLLRASAWPARLMMGALACLTIGGGFAAKRAAERAIAPVMAVQQAVEATRQLSSSFATPAAAPASGGASSSLDLIGSPSGATYDGSSGAPPAAALSGPAATKAAEQILGGVAPMVNDAKALEGLPPAQRQQLQQLGGLLNQMQSQMQSGRQLTPQQRAQMMQMFQQQLGQLNAAPPKAPAAPDGAPR